MGYRMKGIGALVLSGLMLQPAWAGPSDSLPKLPNEDQAVYGKLIECNAAVKAARGTDVTLVDTWTAGSSQLALRGKELYETSATSIKDCASNYDLMLKGKVILAKRDESPKSRSQDFKVAKGCTIEVRAVTPQGDWNEVIGSGVGYGVERLQETYKFSGKIGRMPWTQLAKLQYAIDTCGAKATEPRWKGQTRNAFDESTYKKTEAFKTSFSKLYCESGLEVSMPTVAPGKPKSAEVQQYERARTAICSDWKSPGSAPEAAGISNVGGAQ